MHLAFAQRVIDDPLLPTATRTLLTAPENWGAFLLGSIAPDARVSSGIRREDTHFFEYTPEIAVPPITVMLNQFPQLKRDQLNTDSHIAFVAGYGAHLAMDEIWCVDLLFPYFMHRWDDKYNSFYMLHMLLGTLDARDYDRLPRGEHYAAVVAAQPDRWLPFIPDDALVEWRDLIAGQIAPGASSSTVEILSQRINMPPAEMHSFINTPEQMDQALWRKVPPAIIANVEQSMYDRARDVLRTYLSA
jgi:hypothetical protein